MSTRDDDLADAQIRHKQLRAQARDYADEAQGNVAIVVVPPGLGKTQEELKDVVLLESGTLLGPSHRLLDQSEAKAKALGLTSVRRPRGVLSVLDEKGKQVCARAAEIHPWVAQGLKARKQICPECPDGKNYRGTRTRCVAWAYRSGEGATLAPHALAPILGPNGKIEGDFSLDECPSLVTTEKLELQMLKTLWMRHDASDLHAWCAARQPFAEIVLKAAADLLHGDDPDEARWFTVRTVDSALRARLVDAAGGEEPLAAAIAALASAHVHAPTPSAPSGREIFDGATFMNRPRLDLDVILLSLAKEGTADAVDGESACIAVGNAPVPEGDEGDGVPIKRATWIEYRYRLFNDWTDDNGAPLSMVILDATAPLMVEAIRASLAKSSVKLFELAVPEVKGAVERISCRMSGLTRRALFGRSGRTARLARRADASLSALLGYLAAKCGAGEKVGLVTHKPLALLLRKCVAVLAEDDEKQTAFAKAHRCPRTLEALSWLRERADISEERMLWFGNQRGSNALETCRIEAVLGDPWTELGAAREDGRTLGIDGDFYARALLDVELTQTLGRSREVRRTLENPVTLIHFGKQPPVAWSNIATVEVPHRAGGPVPSRAAILAEQVAREMIDTWGVASPELAKLCVLVPAVAAALSSAHRLRLGPNDTYRTIRAEDLSEIVPLQHRRLQDAFARSAESVGAFMRANPTGHRGRWKLYARSETDADRAIEIIIEALATAGRS